MLTFKLFVTAQPVHFGFPGSATCPYRESTDLIDSVDLKGSAVWFLN